MVGLTVGGEINWQLEPQRIKTLNGKKLELDTSELKNGETLELPIIKVQDFKDLLAELPELDIRGLSKEKSLEKILEYIRPTFLELRSKNSIEDQLKEDTQVQAQILSQGI